MSQSDSSPRSRCRRSLSGAFFVVVGSASFAGCNADGPISVVSAYGPGIKFSGLGPTYAWAQQAAGRQFGSAEMRDLICRCVDRHLAKKGFTSNAAGAGDFLIDFRVARREKTDASVVAHGETIEEGSLVLEIFESAAGPSAGGNRKLIWRGIARARIRESDPPEVRERRLDAAVRALMQQFPAKA